ncbi:primosome assembly protein PriA [Calidifontibacter sp. DB0510]|uniref:Probable replication restart protein PriA n=1 Tax=Metallococcus carri TaxID=1656884 RepID=A0A967EDS3_9MICO|nr:primosome assembly protein PriA [Metallococcus carri]NHN55006.1 primosome assembly protein PriA [Metallococcus carri]NOP37352.1 primosome assembly protein PriA [Calidifontibacter sp. DB2511S]
MTDQPHPGTPEQLQLLKTASRRRPTATAGPTASELPVAVVLAEVGLAHLDRTFEYSVPADLAEAAQPGARVRVRFGGQELAGYVVDRTATAEHVGALVPLRRVVSPEPVLTPTLLALCREVARRYAGNVADVVRLAVPPRHARAEAALAASVDPPVVTAPDPSCWSRYAAGPALLRRIAAGEAPAASWLAAPGEPAWPASVAALAATALAAGRGALIVVPDHRDVVRVAAALEEAVGRDAFVKLTADQGPQARYTAWLKVLRGHVRCVVGTRAAAFAPVADLGLVVCWDDGDPLHLEPRAPYPHVREVLRVRHEQERAAYVLGGFARSVAVQQWLDDGVVREVGGRPARTELPRVSVAGDEREQVRHGPAANARIPSAAWEAARRGLAADGPVLVQVPRRGYVPRLRCAECREPARCPTCQGPLQQEDADGALVCGWCNREVTGYRCPECEGTRLRATVVGARRTAEELGRAFPGEVVRRSGAGQIVLDTVPHEASLVISTPGAEPVADGGYAAAILLDGWALTERPGLQSGEQALRQWLAAAALVRPGGPVVLCGADPALPVVQALVRWAPGWFAQRECEQRAELGLPPTTWAAIATGGKAALEFVAEDLAKTHDAVGPAPIPGSHDWRLLLRAPLAAAIEAARAVAVLRAHRALQRDRSGVSVRVDLDGSAL